MNVDALFEWIAEYLEMDPDHWNKEKGEFQWGTDLCRFRKTVDYISIEVANAEHKVDRFDFQPWLKD
ncbi:hypothetical protein [Sphingobium phenoxybenzoativorans]|uniref:hypothetical protein n=1 Tax=Sphingobium phenoxybenzoativorans TaxID=1592790 RepID=UPI001112E179|nr:hypothetical protein [Sphingobium phenoxybenzoativorans]